MSGHRVPGSFRAGTPCWQPGDNESKGEKCIVRPGVGGGGQGQECSLASEGSGRVWNDAGAHILSLHL